jgi:hypothetical protein
MADQVLKTVRITDNIKVEVLQQGKKRKYALFYDTDNTKSEKYDVAMSDDDVIKESLLEYGRLQSSKGKPLGQLPQFYYKVIQDPYKDPFIKRTYGNGDKSPYYLNNGCSINIEWEGWANSDPIITSSDDDADAKKGSNNASLVYAKSVTVYLPKGFTENGGKGYLVWTDTGLRYNDDKNVYKNSLDKGQKNGAIILKPRDSDKDSEIVEHIIASFVAKVTNLHGYDYRGLKLCSPDTEACSLIPYKSPLEPPSPTPIQTPVETPVGTPVGMSQSKIKFTIDGLPSEIILKAKEDLDTFTIWTGPIPKINNGSGNVDDVDDDLDDEYKESEFIGEGENIVTPEVYKLEINAAIEDAKSVVDDSSTSNNGITVKGLAPNSPLPANAGVPAGFNGVPLYNQFDPRWAKSPYNTGGSCANKTVSSSGCGPTAVSMVINYWATKGKCNPVTPAVVAKFFADNGAFVCGQGSDMGRLNKEKFKNTFGITMKTGVTEAQIMAALRKGYPCVMSGASYRGYNFKGERIGERYNGGHVVCLTGIDSQGRIRVNDSGSSPTGGKGITAFIEGKNPSGGVGEFRQRLILYPSNMSSPIA